MDRRIRELYGDWVHSNKGVHLSGGGSRQQKLAYKLEDTGDHACVVLRRAERESQTALFVQTDLGTHGSQADPLE